MSQRISVVVPVFNNQATLEETCRQIMEVHRGFGELALEIVFVNDGSTDSSWQELERLQSLHKETVSSICPATSDSSVRYTRGLIMPGAMRSYVSRLISRIQFNSWEKWLRTGRVVQKL